MVSFVGVDDTARASTAVLDLGLDKVSQVIKGGPCKVIFEHNLKEEVRPVNREPDLAGLLKAERFQDVLLHLPFGRGRQCLRCRI